MNLWHAKQWNICFSNSNKCHCNCNVETIFLPQSVIQWFSYSPIQPRINWNHRHSTHFLLIISFITPICTCRRQLCHKIDNQRSQRSFQRFFLLLCIICDLPAHRLFACWWHNNYLFSWETQKSASLSFCTRSASVSINGRSCCNAGLSTIVSSVLLSMSRCCTSLWCKPSKRWWDASTGFFASVALKPNSSKRCSAIL